ncbi:MAG: hypothetical protein IT392_00205 [Nitrospirae bacterium]|nr:hypothetical protein [Nitrospirota bacterium]
MTSTNSIYRDLRSAATQVVLHKSPHMVKNRLVVLMTVVLILFLPVFVLAGTVELPETGQTTCYNSSGSVIACPGTGQDGDIQAGVPWPSPRFTAGTGTGADCVTDNLTGLMWQRMQT